MNKRYCDSLVRYSRRKTIEVMVGNVGIGGDNPLRLQSMTNTDTNDTDASVDQIMRIVEAGGEIVRLTAQGPREADNLGRIKEKLRARGCDVPLVADIHFMPEAAIIAAGKVEKVRINPGNFSSGKTPRDSRLGELIEVCRLNGTALRIGVNHGSLSPYIVERYGDTPEGMVESAMEYLRECRSEIFDQVVVSMKSSNVRVMVYAYRMLAAAMAAEGMRFPLHLGVTEAGNDLEGRIKSAAGIGALLADGLGDTIRVSLTEAPEREIPVARMLAAYFEGREDHGPIPEADENLYSPYEYRRRVSESVAGVGGGNRVIVGGEITPEMTGLLYEADASENAANIPEGKIVVLTSSNKNAPAAMRSFFLRMEKAGRRNPVIIKRIYDRADPAALAVEAAADTGLLFLDGYGDGLWIKDDAVPISVINNISLSILQAARIRMEKPEYIACPGCGRTLYNLEETLNNIKERTAGMAGVKIGVMGCIVNGPGEMADADYGYVGSGPGRITLYKGKEVVKRNIPQEKAIEELIKLINSEKQ